MHLIEFPLVQSLKVTRVVQALLFITFNYFWPFNYLWATEAKTFKFFLVSENLHTISMKLLFGNIS